FRTNSVQITDQKHFEQHDRIDARTPIILTIQGAAFFRDKRKVDGFIDFSKQVILGNKVFYVDCFGLKFPGWVRPEHIKTFLRNCFIPNSTKKAVDPSLSTASLPTFVGSPFLFDAMGARRRMRPPILSFPRCRIFWNACGIIYSVVESGGKWGEGETAGCSWGNTGIPWTIRVVCSSLPNSGRDWVPPLSSPAVWTAVSSHIPARNGLSSNRN